MMFCPFLNGQIIVHEIEIPFLKLFEGHDCVLVLGRGVVSTRVHQEAAHSFFPAVRRSFLLRFLRTAVGSQRLLPQRDPPIPVLRRIFGMVQFLVRGDTHTRVHQANFRRISSICVAAIRPMISSCSIFFLTLFLFSIADFASSEFLPSTMISQAMSFSFLESSTVFS